MKHNVATGIAAIAVACALSLGSASAASAAPMRPSAESVSGVLQSSAAPAVAKGVGFDKLIAFAGCVTGVGVPIGVAWALAGNPAFIRFVLGTGPLPASAGGLAAKYLWYIKGTCGYALFGR